MSEDTLCVSEASQFTTTAVNGCNGGTYSYAWAPAVGLSNASIANPIATPSATTTYTVTVTENGSCTAPQTVAVTLNVAPMPTASTSQILGNCESFEPYTSNIYTRRVLSGEFVCVNPHMVNDLIKEVFFLKILNRIYGHLILKTNLLMKMGHYKKYQKSHNI